MKARERRPPGVRVVHYALHVSVSLPMEVLLGRGKSDGTLTEGDCSSSMIWFEGRPGKRIREFRDRMVVLSGLPEVRGGTPEAARLVRKAVRAQRPGGG